MDKGEGNVKYVLTGDGAGTLFLIDEKSGDIHATKRLDREEKAMYTLHAKVLDRNTNAELEPDTEFNIKIHDINDNAPKFAKDIYFASVPEMSEVGKLRLVLFWGLNKFTSWSMNTDLIVIFQAKMPNKRCNYKSPKTLDIFAGITLNLFIIWRNHAVNSTLQETLKCCSSVS